MTFEQRGCCIKEHIPHTNKLAFVAEQSPTPWSCCILNACFWAAISIVFFIMFILTALAAGDAADSVDDDDVAGFITGFLVCLAFIFLLLFGFSLYHLYKATTNRRTLIFKAAEETNVVVVQNQQQKPTVQVQNNPTIQQPGVQALNIETAV